MTWPPVDDAVGRRDDALHRTRRISWRTAGGALAATAVLGVAFARTLPGHAGATAAGSTGGASGNAAAGAGASGGSGSAGSPGASPHHARSHKHKPGGQAASQPPPAPRRPPPRPRSCRAARDREHLPADPGPGQLHRGPAVSATHLAAGAGAGLAPLWYTTRATGEVALALLTATVVLGVAGVTRFATPRWPRLVMSGLHRNLSLMAVAFLAGHILTALLDTYAPVGWSAAVLPFSSSYRPFWLGLGTLAFDLLLAVMITSLLRARLRYRSWRAIHWTAYAAWPLALWHGLGTGTDGRLPWLLAIDAICLASVLATVLWRVAVVGPATRRLGMAGVGAVFALATVLFVAVGPLRPGWARRAGTRQPC